MQRLRKRILSHLTLIKIIITIIVLLQTQACSDFANDPLDKNSNISISPNLQMNSIAIDNKLDKSVNVISKYLAIMLEDKEIRKSLALEFQLSKNHHKIIDCLSFLKKDISVNLKPAKVSDKILENLTGKEKNDLNNYINSMLTNYLFIGFLSCVFVF